MLFITGSGWRQGGCILHVPAFPEKVFGLVIRQVSYNCFHFYFDWGQFFSFLKTSGNVWRKPGLFWNMLLASSGKIAGMFLDIPMQSTAPQGAIVQLQPDVMAYNCYPTK